MSYTKEYSRQANHLRLPGTRRQRLGVAGLSMSGILGLGMIHHGMDTSAPSIPDRIITPPTTTVTVTVAPSLERTVKPGINPVVVYNLYSSEKIKGLSTTSDREVRQRMSQAAQYLSYDFDEAYSMRLQSIEDIVEVPQGKNSKTKKPCYTIDQIEVLSDNLLDTYSEDDKPGLFFVSNDLESCPTVDSNGKEHMAAAYANKYLFFNNTAQSSHFQPSTILHEYGHLLGPRGLPHYASLKCTTPENMYDPTDYALRDISEIVSGRKNQCDVARSDDGSVDVYSARGSIMGRNPLNEFNFENGIVPAYSNLDRTTALPHIYRVEKVALEPATYRLEYAKNAVNGIELLLTEGHPLKNIDPRLTKIVIMSEVAGGSRTHGEEYASPRTCKVGSDCDVSVTATNDDYTLRYMLPSTRYWYDTDGPIVKSIVYLDKTLGIGVSKTTGYNASPSVAIVGIETAKQLSAVQRAAYAGYIATLAAEDSMRQQKTRK